MPERYKLVEGSQSAHCCFDFTIVDTEKPVEIGGKVYAPDGVTQYDALCECFELEDAQRIVDALNGKVTK